MSKKKSKLYIYINKIILLKLHINYAKIQQEKRKEKG